VVVAWWVVDEPLSEAATATAATATPIATRAPVDRPVAPLMKPVDVAGAGAAVAGAGWVAVVSVVDWAIAEAEARVRIALIAISFFIFNSLFFN
jgi:hypothetical protein